MYMVQILPSLGMNHMALYLTQDRMCHARAQQHQRASGQKDSVHGQGLDGKGVRSETVEEVLLRGVRKLDRDAGVNNASWTF